MATIRPGSDQDRAALKAAVRRALDLAGGGDSFCQATRVGAPALSNYTLARMVDMHMPIDVALDLDLDIGEPVIAAQMARQQGYRLVPIGEGQGDDAPALTDIAAVGGESGDVVRKALEYLADGILDPNERASLRVEIDELSAALNRLAKKVGGGNR